MRFAENLCKVLTNSNKKLKERAVMNFDAMLEPVFQFFSHGIGATIAEILRVVYEFLYPSNAGAATTDPGVETALQP